MTLLLLIIFICKSPCSQPKMTRNRTSHRLRLYQTGKIVQAVASTTKSLARARIRVGQGILGALRLSGVVLMAIRKTN